MRVACACAMLFIAILIVLFILMLLIPFVLVTTLFIILIRLPPDQRSLRGQTECTFFLVPLSLNLTAYSFARAQVI